MNWNINPLAFFEFFIVLAFGIGWLILEWNGRRLDKKRLQWEEEAAAKSHSRDGEHDAETTRPRIES